MFLKTCIQQGFLFIFYVFYFYVLIPWFIYWSSLFINFKTQSKLCDVSKIEVAVESFSKQKLF